MGGRRWELVLLAAIVALLGFGARSTANLHDAEPRLRETVRTVLDDLRLARTQAVADATEVGWVVVSPTMYRVADREVDLGPTNLRIESPAPGRAIGFTARGMRLERSPDELVLRATETDRCYTVTIADGGHLDVH